MSNLFNIEGKCVAITGGAGVLCGQMAKSLAEAGAAVAILDYNLKGAAAVCDEITLAGGKAVAVECNVLDKDSVANAVDQTIAQLGRIDVLINGAGGNKREATCVPPETFFDMDPEAVKWVFELNCLGTIMPSQAVGKHLAERGCGSIINVSSMSAFTPLTRIAAYSAAKGAVHTLTKALAVELAPHGITVNEVAPGPVDTAYLRANVSEEAYQQRIDRMPAGRLASPDDCARAVLHLAADDMDYVTGQTLYVDGGFLSAGVVPPTRRKDRS